MSKSKAIDELRAAAAGLRLAAEYLAKARMGANCESAHRLTRDVEALAELVGRGKLT